MMQRRATIGSLSRSLMTACIAVGLPLLAAAMHNATHHGMVHRIKSRHGLLRPYSGTDQCPHEGTGQGSGASPAIWLIYMVTLLNAFKYFSPGMKVRSPYQNDLMVVILAIFFVDDGMPGINDATEESARPLEDLLIKVERVLQAWERLLFASGGALELTKCFAYVLYWDLSKGNHRLLLPEEIPGCVRSGADDEDTFKGPISVTYGNKSAMRHPLDTISPWVGRRTVGVRIAPAGSWADELAYRQSQARDISLLLSGSSLSRDTACLGYKMMVCPKIEFPLTVTQFSQKECDSISAPFIRVSLSKMGFNCNMPREVIYGPPSVFGLGFHDLYVEQGIKQVTALVGHLRQDSDTGRMMRIELQWCQMQAGSKAALLMDTDVPIDYIETCWIMGIRDFIMTYNLKIEFTDTSLPHATQRAGDCLIMDKLRTNGNSTPLELQRLNACRLFLRVARLSDITSIDGKRIREDTLAGKEKGPFSSSLNWPRQGRPPQSWWLLWKKKLKLAFSTDGSSPTLRSKLGNWTPEVITDEWTTLANTTLGTTEVYIRKPEGGFFVFRDNTDERRGAHYRVKSRVQGTVDTLPHGTVPAELGKIDKKGFQRVILHPMNKETSDAVEDATDSETRGLFQRPS